MIINTITEKHIKNQYDFNIKNQYLYVNEYTKILNFYKNNELIYSIFINPQNLENIDFYENELIQNISIILSKKLRNFYEFRNCKIEKTLDNKGFRSLCNFSYMTQYLKLHNNLESEKFKKIKLTNLNISIDAEWCYLDKNNNIIEEEDIALKRKFLSIQFAISYKNFYLYFVFYKQLELSEYIKYILSITNIRSAFITLIGFLNIVDLSILKDFKEIVSNTLGIRKSIVNAKPFDLKVYFNKNLYTFKLYIRDIKLLSAGGSLDKIAKSINMQKINIESYGFTKNNMYELFTKNFNLFNDYAIRDVDITLKFVNKLYKENDLISITLQSEIAKEARDFIIKTKGYKDTKEFDFKYRFLETNKIDFNKKLYIRNDAEILYALSQKAFSGGRNETYGFGIFYPLVDKYFYDYDVISCYPTAMCLIPDVTDEIELTHNKQLSLQECKYINDNYLFFALCEYEYNNNVNYPLLYTKDKEGRGLIFCKKGEGVYTGIELYAALLQGAKIFIKQGVLLKTCDNYTLRELVIDLIKKREEAKKNFGKGSLQEVTQKLKNNSLYGKFAQGIALKKNYSPRLGHTEIIPASIITIPWTASYITAWSRVICSLAIEELVNTYPKATVTHLTTDGFCVDLSEEKIKNLKLYGLSDKVKEVRKIISDKEDIFEVKHKTDFVITFKTRGYAGLGEIPFEAKAGLKLQKEENKAKEVIKIYLERQGKIKNEITVMPCLREIIKSGDVIFKKQIKNINYEYDFKRNIDEETIDYSYLILDHEIYLHVKAYTKPWDCIEDFDNARKAIKNMNASIKTIEDLKQVLLRIKRRKYVREMGLYQHNDLNREIAIHILRAVYDKKLILKIKIKEFLEILNTKYNLKLTWNDIRNIYRNKDIIKYSLEYLDKEIEELEKANILYKKEV